MRRDLTSTYEAMLRWEESLLRVQSSTDSLDRSKAALARARHAIEAGRAKSGQRHFDARLDRTKRVDVDEDRDG